MNHSPTPAEEAALLLLTEGITAPFTTIRITETMLEKSIIDAHIGVRELLFEAGIADYGKIAQGEKRIATATVCTDSAIQERSVSLYRPKTKAGDPRFWIYDGRKLLQGGDLLVLGTVGKNLWVAILRLASPGLVRRVAIRLDWVKDVANPALDILKEKLQEIRALGWIQTMRSGDTGVGFTLESLLEIQANSSTLPDFHGIEIKSKRSRPGGRQTLFTKTPDWTRSLVAGTAALVNQFGYDDLNGRRSLYCTVQGTTNPQGFSLECSSAEREVHVVKDRSRVLVYPYDSLRTALETKHPETVFVSAKTRVEGGLEHFHYDAAVYCRDVSFPAFLEGIIGNRITLDLAGHIKVNGVGRDHGYLWRTHASQVHLLYALREVLI